MGFNLFNIGNGNPVNLLTFIETIEKAMGKIAKKEMYPMQPGDVHKTWADTQALETAINYKPLTNLKTGIDEFVEWFKRRTENGEGRRETGDRMLDDRMTAI